MLPHQARALCEAAGIVGILDLPRFARAPMFDSAEIEQEYEDLLADAFRAEDLAHWRPQLLATPNIAVEVAATSEQSLDHPQIVHNGDVITIDDPVVGPVRQIGPIGHFEKTPVSPVRSAPALGEHGGELLPGPRPVAGGGEPRHPFSESVSVDLRTPEGRLLAQRIVAKADAFVTGFRSGIADKLGLGYEELRVLNPRLVYLHAAGYGSEGPYAHRAMYAQAASAVGGSFGRQVGYWMNPELSVGMSRMELQAVVFPRLYQVIDGDSNAALDVLVALSLAIYDQQRTGEGEFARTSMIAGNALGYSDDFCACEGKKPVLLCDDEYYATSALERLYEAADGGWVCLAVQTDAEFSRLTTALGVPELLADDRFAWLRPGWRMTTR